MDFQIIIKIILTLLVAISIVYIITYFDWKHNILPFSEEEEHEYRKLLCGKLGLDYFAFKYDSIESLEKQIDQRHCNIQDLRNYIQRDKKLILFGSVVDKEELNLIDLFFRIDVSYESRGSGSIEILYGKRIILIFHFIPIYAWEKIEKTS
jgi:hypothetical protein